MDAIIQLLQQAEKDREVTILTLNWTPPHMTLGFLLHCNNQDYPIIYGSRPFPDHVEFLDTQDLVDELWCTPNLVRPLPTNPKK